jgi:hypothetical protein
MVVVLLGRSHLGAKLDIWQEEVYAVKDFTAALPDTVEAQPADRHYCGITAGCCAWILLIAYLHQSFTHSVIKSLIIVCHTPSFRFQWVPCAP